jgi:hypothetical protein
MVFLIILGIVNFLGLSGLYVYVVKTLNKEAQSITTMLTEYNKAMDSFETRLQKMEINFKAFFHE